MDPKTKEALAVFICGDDRSEFPLYRSGPMLTELFRNAGLERFVHDGTSRKKWVVETLRACSDKETEFVIKRLADPREYGGDQDKVDKAHEKLNRILKVEGRNVWLYGMSPQVGFVSAGMTQEVQPRQERELKPQSPPDFRKLNLGPGIDGILSSRWTEIERCVGSGAHLGSIVLMGSLLEGMLLATAQRFPKEANQSTAAPKTKDTQKVKQFHEWTLSDMINVARDLDWIDLDVQRFSHALRDFRNLIHPYQQLASNVYPDADTVNICWLVVQAACNDLARVLRPGAKT